jgi:nucleoside-diphosphate-sugar epimerase
MADQSSISKIQHIILDECPDLIFHYAAINGTQYFYDIPSKVLEVNTQATFHLMSALRNVKVSIPEYYCKVIYASSSEVYGEPFSLPTKETDITYVDAEHVRDSYAVSKLIGEFYIKLFAQELGLDYINLRLFNVYGPRMIGTKYGQVIPEFIDRLSNGEYPLNIYGNGEHMRSFCYISDNIALTIDLALSSHYKATYNIGNNIEVSIAELGTLIMKKMGLDPKFVYLPERAGDHKRRCPDTSKLHHVLGNHVYIPLEAGIDLLLNNDHNRPQSE